MKKIVIIFCLVLSCSVICQQNNDSIELDKLKKNILEDVTQKNSANWKDVIVNYFQLAMKDLGGKEKKFELKTTLFNLKAQTNNDLWIDYNYEKENFTRNFQIETGISLNEDYHIKGFTYGIGWTYNKRDRSINTLINEKSDTIYQAYREELTDAKNAYSVDLLESNDPAFEKKIKEIDSIENQFKSSDEIKIIPIEKFPKEFRKYLSENYRSYPEKFVKAYKEDVEKIERKPYFFIGFNNTFNKNSKFFDNYKIQSVFLKGVKTDQLKMEIDFRNELVSTKSFEEDAPIQFNKYFSSQLGLNISLLSKGKSFLEIKPLMEFKKSLDKDELTDDSDGFFAGSDLRIRIYKDVWIPLLLKYDMKRGNLFGFLNVSVNLK